VPFCCRSCMIRGCDGDGPSEKMSTDVNRRQPELVTPLLCHLALLASRHLLLIPDPSRLLTLATARHLRSSGCRHDTLWSEVQSTTKLHECQKSSRTSHSGSGCCQHHAGHCMCNWGLSPPAIHLRGIDLAPHSGRPYGWALYAEWLLLFLGSTALYWMLGKRWS